MSSKMVNLLLSANSSHEKSQQRSTNHSGGNGAGGSNSGTNEPTKSNSKSKRRATFGGSRLSLHSLLFPHKAEKEANNDQKISRSTNDLQQAQTLAAKSRSTHEGSVDATSSCSGPANVIIEDRSIAGGSIASGSQSPRLSVVTRECPLCFVRQPLHCFARVSCCHHQSCSPCMITYLQSEIRESRVMITCPECAEKLHPTDVHRILVDSSHIRDKYEEFMLRRTLMFDPDTRWCPAPDCKFVDYAVIAHNCAGCPQLHCERPGCGAYFCYHCKMAWHPMQTCDEARAQRGSFHIGSVPYDANIRPGDIKACPRCRTYIVKMNDGSCNHMVCGLCSAEFCWLCLKEISDLHYLSPSGCTFWGKKPWSRKKKLLWQLGTLIGAPVGITLIAGLAVPAIIFGVPIVLGRKVHKRLSTRIGKHKRRTVVALSVIGSFVISPVVATITVAIGVPILLAYVYGVVPVSLCRNGGCSGVTASTSGLNLDEPEWLNGMTGAEQSEKSKLLRASSSGTTGGDRGGLDGTGNQSAMMAGCGDTSTVTGLSIGSGSGVSALPNIGRNAHRYTSHHSSSSAAPITVQAELYGASSGGGSVGGGGAGTTIIGSSALTASQSAGRARLGSMESANTNYEEASTRACAGSTAQAYYFADDKSVHTIISDYGGNALAQEGCSVRALAGSVVETKSCGGVSAGGDSVSMRVLTGSIGPDNVSGRHPGGPVTTAGTVPSDTGAQREGTHGGSGKLTTDAELRTSPAPLLEEAFDEYGAAIEGSTVTTMCLGQQQVQRHALTTKSTKSSLSINSLQPPPNAAVCWQPGGGGTVLSVQSHDHDWETSTSSSAAASKHRKQSVGGGSVKRGTPWRSGSGVSAHLQRMRAASEVSYGGAEYIEIMHPDDVSLLSHEQSSHLPPCQHQQQQHVKQKKILKTPTNSSTKSHPPPKVATTSFRFADADHAHNATSVSRRHLSTDSATMGEGDGEFMLMSAEAFHQIHSVSNANSTTHLPGSTAHQPQCSSSASTSQQPGQADDASESGASTVHSRASELWQQLLNESGTLATEPWLMWSRIKHPKSRRRTQRSRTQTSGEMPAHFGDATAADGTADGAQGEHVVRPSTSYISLPDTLHAGDPSDSHDELEHIVVERPGGSGNSDRRKSSSGPIPTLWSRLIRR